jgi:hypothetical protein
MKEFSFPHTSFILSALIPSLFFLLVLHLLLFVNQVSGRSKHTIHYYRSSISFLVSQLSNACLTAVGRLLVKCPTSVRQLSNKQEDICLIIKVYDLQDKFLYGKRVFPSFLHLLYSYNQDYNLQDEGMKGIF